MNLKPRTGGQILVDQLRVHGVDHLFCVPGESYLAVLDALVGKAADKPQEAPDIFRNLEETS